MMSPTLEDEMRQFPKIAIVIALFSAAVAPTPAAHAAEKAQVTLNRVVAFAESSGASDNVKAECTLDTRLPGFIKDFAKNVVLADDVGEDTEGRVLHLTFTNVIGTGGGAWSGSKSVTVEGKLTENGEVIGTFTAIRYSGGGAFAAYKGTCSILGRCIKAIGKDIAEWLAHPTMKARLGNA
jgi:hypothetical protein